MKKRERQCLNCERLTLNEYRICDTCTKNNFVTDLDLIFMRQGEIERICDRCHKNKKCQYEVRALKWFCMTCYHDWYGFVD